MQRHIETALALWHPWEGEGHMTHNPDSLVFFTEATVNLHEDIYRESLARALQREGVADGLGAAFKALETARVETGYAGELEDSTLFECDEDGETYYGDKVTPKRVTWVEVVLDD
jgi:hypothetical protein